MEILYKLINVGEAIHDSSIGAYRIVCYFQPWLILSNTPASEEIVSHAINSTLAGNLICGTIWTRSKPFNEIECLLTNEYEAITIEQGIIHARRLKDLFNLNKLSHSKFWANQENTWVVQLKHNNKIFIITYFELLRACFYATSRRATDFFFSQNSISSLCIPLEFPNASNLFTARYCIATEKCTASEARLIGNLLFDPKLLYAFNLSQAYWRNSISQINAGTQDKRSTIPVGDFSSFSFISTGQSILYESNEYFWVNNLEVTNYKYEFNALLFYPIYTSSKKDSSRNLKQAVDEDAYQPKCPDILQLTHQQSFKSEMKCCLAKAMKDSDSKWLYAIRKSGTLPLVIRRFPWASLLPRSSDLDTSERLLKESVQRSNLFFATKAFHTHRFHRLITAFKSNKFTIKPISINNSDNVFGRNVSVLPINRHSPLPITLYEKQISCFSCIEMHLDNTPFYIAQPFPESNPELAILFIKQNLIQPKPSEWNELLSCIVPVRNRFGLTSFYKSIHYTKFKQASNNTAFLAIPIPCETVTVPFCIDLVNHVIDRFRKRLQFVLATLLKYPDGASIRHQNKIRFLSRNICTTPDASWLVRIYYLWN
ncbi:hypothetical protein [Hymenobacter ruricola]|uniref:Uncharacterized protein n=1 Tax=Hymenobacter ruricola TaxID=2791023 RepID=A0ABS0IBB7_9BACT|nr:hypothetical protein [Hymenobacter ruricola]MBF9223769.1 hypothetical protein [Hymenobacter ruricola]